jgi:diguanylate cyclase (GGDEF)-like protein
MNGTIAQPSEPGFSEPLLIVVARPASIGETEWTSLIQTLTQVKDCHFRIVGIVDPHPPLDLQLLMNFEGIPVLDGLPQNDTLAFTHVAVDTHSPAFKASVLSGKWIPFDLLESVFLQTTTKNSLLSILTRFHTFIQSITRFDNFAAPYAFEIAVAVKNFLHARRVFYCESDRVRKTLTVKGYAPQHLLSGPETFPMPDVLESSLSEPTLSIQEFEPFPDANPFARTLGFPHAFLLPIEKTAGNIDDFLMVVPDTLVDTNARISFEFQNAAELCTPVLNTSYRLFRHYELLRFKAEIDQLTRILNRDSIEKILQLEWEKAVEEQKPFSVLMLDLDHFKDINDTRGHQAGDETLFTFAQAVSQTLRGGDRFGRYGGEEFLILLPKTPKAIARTVGERIRVIAERLSFPGMPDLKITVSIGVSSYPEDARDPEDLLKISDQMLYRSKNEGRNRISALE